MTEEKREEARRERKRKRKTRVEREGRITVDR